MRTVQFELMRPGELRAAMERLSVAYLPMGPLEWHGPHMPLGTDPLDAQAVARGVAEKIGGVVFPTLYCGTERARDPDTLRYMGFEDENMYLVGMDIPGACIKSCYFPEEVFGLILREHLRQIVQMGFRLVVMVNGHGADGQIATGERLAKEFTHTTTTTVLFTRAMQKLDENDTRLGHANICETSMQMYISADSVCLKELPSREIPIRTNEFGIADALLFQGKGNSGRIVEQDPRDATPELGKRYVDNGIEKIAQKVLETYASLNLEKN